MPIPVDIVCLGKVEGWLLSTENVPTCCVGIAEDRESTFVAEMPVNKSVVAASSSTAVLELTIIDGTSSSVEDANIGTELETATIESGTDVTAPIRVGSGRTESVFVDTSVASTEGVGNECVED